MPQRTAPFSPERSPSPLPTPTHRETPRRGGPYAPTLELNAQGNIRRLTSPARRLLEYRPEQEIDPCFFAHVHGKNLYQVMQDVAAMVCYGKTRASWLIRLRTGQSRWRWYRATATSRLDTAEPYIHVVLRNFYDW